MVSVDVHRQAKVQEEAEVKENVGSDQGHVEEEG